jgi:hypothetical protein
MKLSQPLSEEGIVRYYALAREYGALLEGNLGITKATWF